MTRREHIEQLAAELDIELVYSVPRYMMAAHLLSRTVLMNDWDEVPEDEVYWVALHEMGHIETTPLVGYERDLEHDVEWEARAWAWAIEHAEFPLATAGQSSIAWGITDYINGRGMPPASDALRQLYEALGPEPDWYMNVTTPEHWAKLEDWGKPNWAALGELLTPASAPAA